MEVDLTVRPSNGKPSRREAAAWFPDWRAQRHPGMIAGSDRHEWGLVPFVTESW